MGIRLNICVGWGIKNKDFLKHTLIKDKDKYEALHDIMHNADFSIDEEYYKKHIFDSTKKSITTKHLIANESHSYDHMYRIVSDPDVTHGIVFWPTSREGKSLNRSNNTLDLLPLFHNFNGKKTKSKNHNYKSIFCELDQNPYPYHLKWMDKETKEYLKNSFIHFEPIEKQTKYIPCPPGEIYYYLEKLKIFNTETIDNYIRPVYCRWWS